MAVAGSVRLGAITLSWGDGVPTHTPGRGSLYMRTDAGNVLYERQASWVVVAGGGGGGSTPIATTLATGTVKVDHDSAGDPVALTSAGHGAASAPHAGHALAARLISTTAPLTGGGNLSADRTLGVSDATTTAKGVVELATDGEAIAGVVVQGNDSRLSNTRDPAAHAASHANGGADQLNVAGLLGVLNDPQKPQIGATGTTAVAGNDSRLTNARTPLAHAPSHEDGGLDVLAVTSLAGFPGGTTTFLRADKTFAAPPSGGGAPAAHAASHQNGGTDEISVAGLSGLLADAQTPAAHTHPQSEVSGLTTDLAARVQVGGQLSGTATSPTVVGIRESSGPTNLTIGPVADGQYLKRSGTTLQGDTPAGGSGITAAEAPGSLLRRGTTANRWNIGHQMNGAPLTTLAVTLGRLYAFPLYIHKALRLQDLGFNVSTAVAASNGRIGIYADDGNGYPGSLLTGSDVAALATATTGFKSNAMPATTAMDLLAGRVYWVAANFSHAVTLRAVALASCWPILGFDNAAATVAPGLGWIATLAFGALPASYPAGAAIHVTIAPAFYARYVL